MPSSRRDAPHKVALSASGAFAGVSAWLRYLGDWHPLVAILSGTVAAAITGCAAYVADARRFQTSLSVVRIRATKHVRQHQFTYSALGFAVFATAGSLCAIVLETGGSQPAVHALSAPDITQSSVAAKDNAELENVSSVTVMPATSQNNTVLAFAEADSISERQAPDFLIAVTPPEPLVSPVPLPRRRFVNPCALEPNDENGEFPLNDYNACLAYLKKHPPKSGIGGPGFPPLPRPRPFIESIPPFQLNRDYFAR